MMNENALDLVNSFDNFFKNTDRNDYFSERRTDRVVRTVVNQQNENELLNAMISANLSDENFTEIICQRLHSFYSKNSIVNYIAINDIIKHIITLILGGDQPSVRYGLKCFIAIFCQPTYPFDKFSHIAETMLVEVKELIRSSDQIIIQYTLHIMASISSSSKSLACLIAKHVDLHLLANISSNTDICEDARMKALCILGNLCFSITLTPPFVELICGIAAQILPSAQSEKLIQATLYCCAIIVKRSSVSQHPQFQKHKHLQQTIQKTSSCNPSSLPTSHFLNSSFCISPFNFESTLCKSESKLGGNNDTIIKTNINHNIIEGITTNNFWLSLFIQYNLFPHFNTILVNSHSAHSRLYILSLTKYLYQDPRNYDKIDMNSVFTLMNHQISAIQATAIKCVNHCIKFNPDMAQTFLENSLVSIMASVFSTGTRRGKIQMVKLIHTLFLILPNEMVEVILVNNFVSYFLDFLQIVSEESKKEILWILIEINRILNLKQNDSMKTLKPIIEECVSSDFLYELADDENSEISNLANVLFSEIDL
ncbi:hypothetical protein TRFO_37113 [Tritrichomonas foetus]|uniref:Uncharacterized protein n=1 Tax=Tritrichomonas foetus TaxID=1144522 RepID=A0A1J4JC40_9EUKA|nr:hypothetical protein TRFO_37113 [Tritrichomonas foetus]|eukprot:OHS96704.1 hypothetical protein TRFO_37113 [Tritrichomonas foetus]